VAGAFGTAVLYKKKDDHSLVVLKEINMTELNNQERLMAMNEVLRDVAFYLRRQRKTNANMNILWSVAWHLGFLFCRHVYLQC